MISVYLWIKCFWDWPNLYISIAQQMAIFRKLIVQEQSLCFFLDFKYTVHLGS